jgi:hypothetical protein
VAEATVLSTMKGTLKALDSAAIAFKSNTSNLGFSKLSAKILCFF